VYVSWVLLGTPCFPCRGLQYCIGWRIEGSNWLSPTVDVLATFESSAGSPLDISGAEVDHRHWEDTGMVVVFSTAKCCNSGAASQHLLNIAVERRTGAGERTYRRLTEASLPECLRQTHSGGTYDHQVATSLESPSEKYSHTAAGHEVYKVVETEDGRFSPCETSLWSK
jgi:hypothetical protein